MTERPSVSIVINNFNYGQFLGDAIDSALGQTYPNLEVIVVDDGSTDGSPAIIAEYGNRIVPVLKANGGQASAFNVGFHLSRGDVVCFLDSDDMLLPTAIEQAIVPFCDRTVSHVHWPLWDVYVDGSRTGVVVPSAGELAEGDVRDHVLQKGPVGYIWAPTSGNAWGRQFLERVLPMPEREYRTCADTYLALLAPFFGSLRRLPTPQALYREHGGNNRLRISYRDANRMVDHCRDTLRQFLGDEGVNLDPDEWRRQWRWPDLDQAMEELGSLMSQDDRFILVDEDRFGGQHDLARQALPFPERAGRYGGRPTNDQAAIRELRRLRRLGPSFLVFAWPAFAWFDAYPDFSRYLHDRFQCAFRNDRLVVFDLRRPDGTTAP
jgi:glycosyltransferase involved in cell wall biosynthesis